MLAMVTMVALGLVFLSAVPASADPGNGSLTVTNYAGGGLAVSGRTGLVPAGVHRIRWTGGHVDVPVRPGESRSVFLHLGPEAVVAATVVTDELRHPGADRVGVRLVNLADETLRLALPGAAAVAPRTAGTFVPVAPDAEIGVRHEEDTTRRGGSEVTPRGGVTASLGAVFVNAAPGAAQSVVAVRGRDDVIRLHTVVTAAGPDFVLPTEPIETGGLRGTDDGRLAVTGHERPAVAGLGVLALLCLSGGARRRAIAVFAAAALALTGCSVAYSARDTPTESPAVLASVLPPVALGWRGRNIPVREVGVLAGSVITVDDTVHAGWYDWTAHPGGQGTALIVAHDVWADRPAAFRDLGAAKPGDSALVERSDGSRVAFVVDRVSTVVRTALPARFPELFRPTAAGVARLVLVTCTTGRDPVQNVVVELSAEAA
jgi:hypothetical protein